MPTGLRWKELEDLGSSWGCPTFLNMWPGLGHLASDFRSLIFKMGIMTPATRTCWGIQWNVIPGRTVSSIRLRRQVRKGAKGGGSGICLSSYSRPCHTPAICCWESYVISLSLSIPVHTMGIIIIPNWPLLKLNETTHGSV